MKKTHFTKRRRGLTLLEAMFMMVIVSLVAVAAGAGLQAIVKTPTQTDLNLAIYNATLDTVEQWKTKAWASQVSQSDTVTINGKSYARTITVANADPSNLDAGLLTQSSLHRITVTIGPQTLRCYVAQ